MRQAGHRKIGANYIYWPGSPLIKNGSLECLGGQLWRVVDTGGIFREIAGLEFYGGILVPAGVCGEVACFQPEQPFLSQLDALYAQGVSVAEVAIIEGADLRTLIWKAGATVRKL